jgi:hypothetical protein
MVRKDLTQPVSEWLPKAEACGSPDLATFAAGQLADEAAVAAALVEVWSRGQVKGQGIG